MKKFPRSFHAKKIPFPNFTVVIGTQPFSTTGTNVRFTAGVADAYAKIL
jgi:hypothetical protein